MKKLLIGFLLLAFSMACFPADMYAYKMVNGKFGTLQKITSEQVAEYQSHDYTVTSDKVAVYNMAISFGQEQSLIAKGIIPTAEERTLADSSFDQGDIRRACRRIILVPAIAADPNATPPIEATPAVTLETWLDALINSSPQNQKDWIDEKTINIDDPRVVNALSASQLPVTIQDIKREIAKDRRVF